MKGDEAETGDRETYQKGKKVRDNEDMIQESGLGKEEGQCFKGVPVVKWSYCGKEAKLKMFVWC